MAEVFISYARKDQGFARDLHDALKEANRDPWVDWHSIPYSTQWKADFFSAIEAADNFLFIISPLLTLRGHTDTGVSVAWSPDGKRLAMASKDKTAKVWDAASGKELLTLKGHTGSVESVAWSPDGKRLATSGDQTAKVWEAASGKELLTLRGHSGYVLSVAWSPDGQRLATASYDRTAKVWNAASGKELLTLRGHTGWVLGVVWSPDGERLATASYDGTVQVYAMDIHDLMELARQRVTAHPSDEGCKKYLGVDKCPPFPELPWW